MRQRPKLCPPHPQKTNSDCIKCLSVKLGTTETQVTLSDIDRENEKFNMSPGSKEVKGEIDKWDYSQRKPSAQQRKPSTEWKSRGSGETFANYSSDAELISRLGKEFRNLTKIFQQIWWSIRWPQNERRELTLLWPPHAPWHVIWTKGPLMHSCGNIKLVTYKLKLYLPNHASIPLLGMYPKQMKWAYNIQAHVGCCTTPKS